MKRYLLTPMIAVVLLAGCGGSHHHHKPVVHLAPAGQSALGSVHPPGWGSTPPGFSLGKLAPAPTPTAEMLDGIFVSDFHGLAPFALAGYTAGHWPDYLGLHAAFPHAHAVSIAIFASLHAACLDDEPGDATPSQAGPWVLADIHAGFAKPCVYGDLSEMPAIKASLAAALGQNWRARVFLWLAWYRFVPGLVAGYDAVQYTDHWGGRNLDGSTVSLAFLAIAHPPYQAQQSLPVCAHHRMTRAQCATLKGQVTSDQRAAASSQRAYVARGCPVLAQRIGWFSARLHSQPRVRAAHRRGALAASRRVYTQRQCGLFASRVGFYRSLAAKATART